MSGEEFKTVRCPACGSTERAGADVRATIRCSRCKNPIELAGAQIQRASVPAARAPARPKKRKKRKVENRWAGMLLAGAIAAGVVVWVQQPAAPPEPVEQEPPVVAQAAVPPKTAQTEETAQASSDANSHGSMPAGPPRDSVKTPDGWPSFSSSLSGSSEIQVSNPGDAAALIGIRRGSGGEDFVVEPRSTRSVWVPAGDYGMYVHYTDRDGIFKSDISTGGSSSTLVVTITQRTDGNLPIHRVR